MKMQHKKFWFVWSRVLRTPFFERWHRQLSAKFFEGKPQSGRATLGARTLRTGGVGLAVVVASFSTISYQDMQSLASDPDRWLVHLPESPGQSVASATMGQVDWLKTGSVPPESGADIKPVDVSRLTTEIETSPKAQTINRKLKGNRVVSATIQRPPAHFSAGSVIERHSVLSPLDTDKKLALAFLEPKPSNEALKIAAAFHVKKRTLPLPTDNLPVMVASLMLESENSILAYAPEPSVKYPPFAAVFNDEKPISIIPKLNDKDHSWADDPLPKNAFSKRQQGCLASGIYFESRGETARGQAAVAQVILNRVRNPAYPNTICGVVYQNKKWRNRCQFSFACDKIRDRVNNARLWKLAQNIATQTAAGRIWLPEVGSSTHYHATYVRPKWAKRMNKVSKIGLHVFYRTKGGGWS